MILRADHHADAHLIAALVAATIDLFSVLLNAINIGRATPQTLATMRVLDSVATPTDALKAGAIIIAAVLFLCRVGMVSALPLWSYHYTKAESVTRQSFFGSPKHGSKRHCYTRMRCCFLWSCCFMFRPCVDDTSNVRIVEKEGRRRNRQQQRDSSGSGGGVFVAETVKDVEEYHTRKQDGEWQPLPTDGIPTEESNSATTFSNDVDNYNDNGSSSNNNIHEHFVSNKTSADDRIRDYVLGLTVASWPMILIGAVSPDYYVLWQDIVWNNTYRSRFGRVRIAIAVVHVLLLCVLSWTYFDMLCANFTLLVTSAWLTLGLSSATNVGILIRTYWSPANLCKDAVVHAGDANSGPTVKVADDNNNE